MKQGTSRDLSSFLEVLTQGEEQIRQLQTQLDDPASSAEMCKLLAQQIQFTFDKAISVAKLVDSGGSRQPQCPNNTSSGSPRSAIGSPLSENSERAVKEHERMEMSKKRKNLPKWTSQARISLGGSAEGPIYDGFSWRKYGQKDILGAKYPRGYYRCSHRNARGCLATKQVQRSDADASVFDITYRGRHTCLQGPPAHSESAPQEPDMQQNRQNPPLDHDQQRPQHLLSLREGLKVKTEGSDMEHQDPASSSFSFPSTPVSSLKPENQIFSSPPTLEGNFSGGFSPTFFSPTTSVSNHDSILCQMDDYGEGTALNTPESDLTDIISAATFVTNSPMVDIDFILEPHMDFEPNFPFDDSNFFR